MKNKRIIIGCLQIVLLLGACAANTDTPSTDDTPPAEPTESTEPVATDIPAAEPPAIISTEGFSVSFPAKWHVETNQHGTILASTHGETPPFIIIYYANEPSAGEPLASNARERAGYEKFKRSSISDIIGTKKLQGMIAASTWHSEETIQKLDGSSEEIINIEKEGQDEAGNPTTYCSFIRWFHAPHAEVYFSFIDDTTCKEGQSELRELQDSFVWKNPNSEAPQ